MAQKTLKELLNKYLPPSEYESILNKGRVVRSRVDKDKRILEVFADFDEIVPKDKLYDIEAQVTEAYKLSFFRLFPHYPSSLFSYEYITEVLRQTERVGCVAKGFFDDCTYVLDRDTLKIKIAFPENGVFLLERAETPRIIEGIIRSEFDVAVRVVIEHDQFSSRQSHLAEPFRQSDIVADSHPYRAVFSIDQSHVLPRSQRI
jgi:hypothetical protein